MFKFIKEVLFGAPTVASVMAPLTTITENLQDVQSVAQARLDEANRVAREACQEELDAAKAITKLNKLFA